MKPAVESNSLHNNFIILFHKLNVHNITLSASKTFENSIKGPKNKLNANLTHVTNMISH